VIQAENREEKPLEAYELYSHNKTKGYELRGFPMEGDVRKYINVRIFDSHQVTNLTQIPNLVALIFSIIFCLLLFQAI